MGDDEPSWIMQARGKCSLLSLLAHAIRGLTCKKVKVEAQVEQRSIRLGVFSTLNLDLSLAFRWDVRSGGSTRQTSHASRPSRFSYPPLTQNSELRTQNSELRTQNSELRTQNLELRTSVPSRPSRVKETMMTGTAHFSLPTPRLGAGQATVRHCQNSKMDPSLMNPSCECLEFRTYWRREGDHISPHSAGVYSWGGFDDQEGDRRSTP